LGKDLKVAYDVRMLFPMVVLVDSESAASESLRFVCPASADKDPTKDR
jgi:hypothetical protein